MADPEFDDRALSERLGRASGAYPDVNAAYATVVTRAARQRRRRAVVAATAGAFAAVVLLVIAVALRGHDGSQRLVTASTPPTTGAPTTGAPSSTSSTSTSSTTSTSTTTSTSVAPSTEVATSAPVDPPPTVDTTPVDTAPESSDAPVTTRRRPSTTTTPRQAPTTPAPAPTTPPTAPPPTITVTTFDGQGGSIDVQYDGSSLLVVAKRPADHFTGDLRDGSGQRIEVRFTSYGHRTTIRVELREGRLVPTISEWDYPTSTTSVTTSTDVSTVPPSSSGTGQPEGGSWDGGAWGDGRPGPGG